MLKPTTDKHDTSCGLSATAELLVLFKAVLFINCIIIIIYSATGGFIFR